MISALTQMLHELVALPQSLWTQYPVTITALLVVVTTWYLVQNAAGKRRQKMVDDTLAELADREKTSRNLFWHQLWQLGIISSQERLVLAGKYGPGIASEAMLAKIVARLALDRLIKPEYLAEDVVDYFMGQTLKFDRRHGHVEAFWHLIRSNFSDRLEMEIGFRSELEAAVWQRLGHHFRLEDARLTYVAQQKKRRLANRGHHYTRLAYGLQKTWWQIWLEVVQVTFWATINRLRAKTASAPAKADSLR